MRLPVHTAIFFCCAWAKAVTEQACGPEARGSLQEACTADEPALGLVQVHSAKRLQHPPLPSAAAPRRPAADARAVPAADESAEAASVAAPRGTDVSAESGSGAAAGGPGHRAPRDRLVTWLRGCRSAARRLRLALARSLTTVAPVTQTGLEQRLRSLTIQDRKVDQHALLDHLDRATADLAADLPEEAVAAAFRRAAPAGEARVSLQEVVDVLLTQRVGQAALAGASEASVADDVLTLAPGVVVVILLTGLITTFIHQIVAEDRTTDAKLAEDAAKGSAPPVRGSSGPQTVFNIVKNIVGEGMLSLPAGVAAGTGILGAMVIATGFCALLGYTFSIMGRVCHATGGTTHKACAEASSGPQLAQTMAITLLLKTAFTCLSYAIVIGDSFSRILTFFGVEGVCSSRQVVLLCMMAFVLLPLCLQRDLSMLSYTSLIGICGEFFVVMFMQVRYLDGSYLPGGTFYWETKRVYRPDFGGEGADYWGTGVSTFVLLGSLSTAYIAHYNAPKFYTQMRSRSVQQFNQVILLAFLFSLMIYLWVMSVGYLTFGKAANGNILNNYSETDAGATAARVAIGFAVVFGFPLSFTALRDSTLSVLALDGQRRDVWLWVTLGLLLPVGLVGCLMDDLGLVNSLGGAIFGGMIVLVFPGLLLYYAATRTKGGADEFLPSEARLSWLLVALGVVLCVFGSVIVLIKKFSPDTLP